MIKERDSSQPFSQTTLPRMKQNYCSIFYAVAMVIIFAFSYLYSQMFLFNERLQKIEEFQKQQAIFMSVQQEKNEQIYKDLSLLSQLPIQLSVLQNDFKYLSQIQPQVESIKNELVRAQADILVNGNNTNTQMNTNANRIDQIVKQVYELEKEQRNIFLNENNFTTQFNSNSKSIDQILAKVEVLEKDQRNIAQNQNSLSPQVDQNSNTIDEIQTKFDSLEKDFREMLTNESNLATQVNSNVNRIDQLATKIEVLPVLSAKIDSIGVDVPAIQDSIQSLNLKINSDTFNKVEMFGPYYPNQHSISLNVTNSGYTLYQTVQPCILSLKGKAVVTLIATGHTQINNMYGQVSFMVNRTVSLPPTHREKWQFGAQYSVTAWVPVNLTQEFMLEKGIYEFALGGFYPYSESAILLLNAVSFVAKVTYIS